MSHETEGRPAHLTLDYELHVACLGNRRVVLGEREFALLQVLFQADGAVVSTAALQQDVWGGEDGADPARVRLTVTRLRRKLGARLKLETIVGEGYRLS